MVGKLIVATLVLESGCVSVPHAKRAWLDGGFIQYQPWMTDLDERAWKQELDAMHAAGMQMVILQQLQQGDRRYIPDAPPAADPTEIILSYADAHGMKVFVGLAIDSGWWNQNQWSDYLNLFAAKNASMADEIWKRYGMHDSFAGWYLPQEMWEGPFTDTQIALARRYFRSLSDHCKSLSATSPKPVAISPFHKARATPDEVERLYRDFLRGAGVDILMLQDGVGAKGWDDMIDEKVRPYFAAFSRACRVNHVEFWANIECFQRAGATPSGDKILIPADADRIRRQIAATSPFVRKLVTFDFFHYMSPYRSDLRAKKLFEDYLDSKAKH